MYAVRSGEADGAFVDISEAEALKDEADFYPLSDRDYVSCCLVVRRDLTGSREFSDFLRLMDLAADALNDNARRTELMGMDEAFWQTTGLKFLQTE